MNYKEITSKNNTIIKYVKKLQSKPSFARKENLMIIETPKMIEEINQRKIKIVYYFFNNEFLDINCEQNFNVSKDLLNEMKSLTSHSNHLAVVEYVNNEFDFSANCLVLDNVQDPGNVGTLLRSASGFGFKNILLVDSCNIFNSKLIRSAKNALLDLNIKVLDKPSCISFLKENNYKLFGTDLSGSDSAKIQKSDLNALILGNEGSGISTEFKQASDENIKINTNDLESLNVAIAGSIIMYEFNK